ncbi:hypothetical protein FRACYDRAFT_267594 [Fragilariopsis cylindrus CCMP1102]|uniref:C2H2-type domain-containing protein n=1 Tax=Fragilariopsis cylindrus CCMP1102 TaxID=635003 RepID=A0A1E7FQM7_9STRA|nr:hypothetical protein FRACYDRAFT_267594 [Fragilariopsis cylindrus CCMP1102]|eukprot:OEU20405.1 hypothetical protein FRACYDRAFT_267594 [Fragilariopsis cylindrus CCMP1102]
MTTGNGVEDGQIYLDESECYDYQSDTWDCPQCRQEFRSFRALEQHANSGVHSAKAYRCDDCNREFSSLTGLMSHCQKTSCVYANNIVNTLANDYERGPQLMLTQNGNTHTEATLEFDGSAKPNPGNGGSGYVLYNGSGRVLESTSIEIMDGRVTNNQAEYAALVWGMGIERMKPLYKQAQVLEEGMFSRVRYEHIYRHDNCAADEKANEGSNCNANQQRYLSEAKY